MDEKVQEIALQLRTQLENLDPNDYDTLAWSHSFLRSVVHSLESRIPDYMLPRDSLKNVWPALASMVERGEFDEPDRSEFLEDDSDQPGDAPVPAKLNPGPRGLSGGAIVPLPDNELPL